MDNIRRIEGFIDLKDLYEKSEYYPVKWTKGDDISAIVKGSKIKQVFVYNKEVWLYKTLDNKKECYNELVAEELAKDFGLACAYYDLATYEGKVGVITKKFKDPKAIYHLGNQILDYYIKNVLKLEKGTRRYNYVLRNQNSIEGIANALEYYFYTKKNREPIILEIMEKIINMFIFDTLIRNTDRHDHNWGIIEKDGIYDLQPLYDNERFLAIDEKLKMEPYIEDESNMLLEPLNSDLDQLINFFLISDKKYLNWMKDKIAIIDSNNLIKVFSRIEEKIKFSLPKDYKENILESFEVYKRSLEEKIGGLENTRRIA